MKKRTIIIAGTVLCAILFVGILCGILKNRFAKADNEPEKVFLSASWIYNYSDVQELTENSDLIAVIKVEDDGTSSIVGGLPMSDFTATVVTPVYGCDENADITIEMTGGEKEGVIYEIEDDPLMEEGDHYLVFARQNEDGTYTILSGPQGRMTIEDGEVSSLNVANTQVKAANTDSNIVVEHVDTEDFIAEIQSYCD